jgi:transcriptional regulator with XRE-family HTH domain
MINRIQLILKTKNISPSQFADQIQVQRSGVSHILSGRNNPSLDFILKILRTYPEIDADWLLFGKGQMINLAGKPEPAINAAEEIKVKAPVQPDLFAQAIPLQPEPKLKLKEEKVELPAAAATIPEKVIESLQEDKIEKIEKIVVFYDSNTFKEYNPK